MKQILFVQSKTLHSHFFNEKSMPKTQTAL